ncbi:hypothetical protein ABKN59_009593 [Abortiporus biennis]
MPDGDIIFFLQQDFPSPPSLTSGRTELEQLLENMTRSRPLKKCDRKTFHVQGNRLDAPQYNIRLTGILHS